MWSNLYCCSDDITFANTGKVRWWPSMYNYFCTIVAHETYHEHTLVWSVSNSIHIMSKTSTLAGQKTDTQIPHPSVRFGHDMTWWIVNIRGDSDIDNTGVTDWVLILKIITLEAWISKGYSAAQIAKIYECSDCVAVIFILQMYL